jgi:hypothetical protein
MQPIPLPNVPHLGTRINEWRLAVLCCKEVEQHFWPSIWLCVCLSGYKIASVCDKALQLAPLTTLYHSHLSLHIGQWYCWHEIAARVRYDKRPTCRHPICLPRSQEPGTIQSRRYNSSRTSCITKVSADYATRSWAVRRMANNAFEKKCEKDAVAWREVKGRVAQVHAMKAYRGSPGMTPLFVTSALDASAKLRYHLGIWKYRFIIPLWGIFYLRVLYTLDVI